MVLLGLFALVLFLYAGKLFQLQIIETDGNTDNTTVKTAYDILVASTAEDIDLALEILCLLYLNRSIFMNITFFSTGLTFII